MSNIKKCDCDHEWQDWKYGKGLRVHNHIDKKDSLYKWRCSVCNKEKK